MNNPTYKIGLTLSGGGAKGIAHIGVIKALLENDIHPEIVSGTSAGSIIAALYAADISTDDMVNAVSSATFYKIFRLVGIPGGGLVKLDYLREKLQETIKVDSFEALKRPLYVCATNLSLGRPVLFSSGTLFDKVLASCAVPWLFKPIEINGHLYADGGITNNLPANAIRHHCEVLVGANVKPKIEVQSNADLNSYISIAQRVTDLSLWTNSKPNVKLLDVYIAPEKILGMSSLNIGKTKEYCEVGYEETMKHIPKIKAILEEKTKVLPLYKAAS